MSESRRARARLRRTFRYPADDDESGDDVSAMQAMDEQEQEALIANLSATNALQNTQFTRALHLLPVVATLPYVLLLLRGTRNSSSGSTSLLFPILGITSLCSTAFLLHRLPPPQTGLAALDAWIADGSYPAWTSAHLRERAAHPGTVMAAAAAAAGKSPLELILPYLNLLLVVVLFLMGHVSRGQRDMPHAYVEGAFAWIGIGDLPALVYAIVLVSKVVMGGVDPARELTRLKYGYKGA